MRRLLTTSLRSMVAAALAGTMTAAGGVCAIHAQVIDTRVFPPPGPLALGMQFHGAGAINVGQTFIAPFGIPILDTFTFFLKREPGFWTPDEPFSFVGLVRAWGGTTPVGPVLYESELRTYTILEPPSLYRPETFTTGGVPLTPGGAYVAYFTAAPMGWMSGPFVLTQCGTAYPDGMAYVGAAPDGPATDLSGLGCREPMDLAFVARFSQAGTAVPEPRTLVLLATGLLGLGGVALRRRRPPV